MITSLQERRVTVMVCEKGTMVCEKGTEVTMEVGLIKLKMWKHFHLKASYSGSVSIYKAHLFFSASNLSSPGCCHVDLLFTSEEQKKVGSQNN